MLQNWKYNFGTVDISSGRENGTEPEGHIVFA